MNRSILSLLACGSLLLSGCVGTGPNTQRGAVAGGVMGAIAGAVIGNNSGSGNAASGAAIGAVAGAIGGGVLGNAEDHDRNTIYNSAEAAESSYYTEHPVEMPPPVREVVPPKPAPGCVWVPGCWHFDHRGYAWRSGYWTVPPHRHARYIPPRWERRGYGHVYIRGHWHR